MYKRQSVLRRARVYKKRRGPLVLRNPRRRDIAPTGELAGLPARDAPNRQMTSPAYRARSPSNGVRAGFTRPHPQRLLQFEYPHFPIPGISGSGYIANRFHHLLSDRIVHRKLDLCLG